MRWKNICWNANSTHKSDKEMIRRNGWEKLVNDDSLNLFVPQRHKQHDSWTFKYFYLLIQLRLLLLILIYIGIDDAMRFEYVHVQCSHSHTQKKEKTKKKTAATLLIWCVQTSSCCTETKRDQQENLYYFATDTYFSTFNNIREYKNDDN